MCGIIGYVGPRAAVPILIDGLRRLEYRGYDSAGNAVVRGGSIVAKDIAEKALRASGTTLVNTAIHPETQYSDFIYVPDPDRSAERARLGLLGRLVADPCLLEFYSAAPGAEEVRACLSKHFAIWQERLREHGKLEPSPGPFVDSFLWIIAAGAPKSVLTKLRAEAAPRPDWPAGVYTVGADVLRVGIVVASELPRKDPSTLLVRLMAAGPLLAQGINAPNRQPIPKMAIKRLNKTRSVARRSYFSITTSLNSKFLPTNYNNL